MSAVWHDAPSDLCERAVANKIDAWTRQEMCAPRVLIRRLSLRVPSRAANSWLVFCCNASAKVAVSSGLSSSSCTSSQTSMFPSCQHLHKGHPNNPNRLSWSRIVGCEIHTSRACSQPDVKILLSSMLTRSTTSCTDDASRDSVIRAHFLPSAKRNVSMDLLKCDKQERCTGSVHRILPVASSPFGCLGSTAAIRDVVLLVRRRILAHT